MNRNTSRNACHRHWGGSIVDTGIVSINIKLPSQEYLMKFCRLTIYNDALIDKIFHQFMTLLPNLTFFRITICFHRAFATDVVCWNRTLPSLDTWSRTIWDLHVLLLTRQILFPNLSWFFITKNFEHQSVLSRFFL